MKTPPHNLDAEKATLGAILIRGGLSDVGSILRPEDFYLPANIAVADSAWSLAKSGAPVDVVTIMNDMRARDTLSKLEGQESYLMQLSSSVPTAENGAHYARIVKNKAALRQIQKACLATGDAVADSDNPVELAGELRAQLDAIETGEESGTVRIGDVQNAAEEELEGRFENPTKWVVSSGLRSLDSILGGHKPGQQIVIASNPGEGKTSLAWSILIRAAMHGVPSLLFSLEMRLQEMIERAWTFIGEVPGLAYKKPGINEWTRIRQAKGALDKLPLYVNDKKLRLDRMLSEARSWRSKHRGRLALIAVDYLGLVNAKEKGRNREQEVASVSTECKRLAGELECPLILVAQLNRENVKGGEGQRRRPVMSDLRDSGAVEQDADVIVFPWTFQNQTRLIVEKHRNGKTGTVRVDFKRDLMSFYDLPFEIDWHETGENSQ